MQRMEHKTNQWRGQTYQMKKVTNGAQTYQIKTKTINERDTDVPNENWNERGTDLTNEDGAVLNLIPNLTTSARGGYGQRSLLPYRFFYFHMY